MQVWTLTTQKGGAGKTTLATNLAVAATIAGERVLLIDTDPQESAVKWWQRRDAEAPQLVKLNPGDLGQGIDLAHQQGFSLVIIDTAGRESVADNQAILKATFCLIPCQPSIADIEAVYPTVEILKRTERNYAFVLTRCPAVGQDQASAREGLSGLGLVAKPFTVERKAYKLAFATGEGVTEYDPKDKASEEVTELYQWIKQKSARLSV
jgi:chromosome partitioning protein